MYTVFIFKYITHSFVSDLSKHPNRRENLVILGRSRRSQAFQFHPIKDRCCRRTSARRAIFWKNASQVLLVSMLPTELTPAHDFPASLAHFCWWKIYYSSFLFKGKILCKTPFFFGWSCVRRMCTVLNFYLSDTKRKRRVGFIMLSRKSAQPDVSRKCSLAEFHEEVLHQQPEGRLLQIFPLQNPSVALPQYHLLGDQTTAAFDFQVSGAIRLSNSIWPSWPSRCLEVSLPDFFDWFAAHIFIATWLQRVDFGWTPTADSFHFSLGFFCRHWCRHCQSGTTISVCYLRSRPAQ